MERAHDFDNCLNSSVPPDNARLIIIYVDNDETIQFGNYVDGRWVLHGSPIDESRINCWHEAD